MNFEGSRRQPRKLLSSGRLLAALWLDRLRGRFAQDFGGHQGGDELLHAVRLKLDGCSFRIRIRYDSEPVHAVLDVLPFGKNLHYFLLALFKFLNSIAVGKPLRTPRPDRFAGGSRFPPTGLPVPRAFRTLRPPLVQRFVWGFFAFRQKRLQGTSLQPSNANPTRKSQAHKPTNYIKISTFRPARSR